MYMLNCTLFLEIIFQDQSLDILLIFSKSSVCILYKETHYRFFLYVKWRKSLLTSQEKLKNSNIFLSWQ